MKNAEWCIEQGIELKNLTCDTVGLDSQLVSIGCYSGDGTYYEYYKGKKLGNFVAENILTWLDMEHRECILDDPEKLYLANVIRPFRDRTIYVKKTCPARGYEQILIMVKSITNIGAYSKIPLPYFKIGEMYKDMELDRKYTLEELKLYEDND